MKTNREYAIEISEMMKKHGFSGIPIGEMDFYKIIYEFIKYLEAKIQVLE